MNFNSLAFLIYLPVVVGLYWLLPFKARKYWLLAASYFFYMYWNPAFLFLLLFPRRWTTAAAGASKPTGKERTCAGFSWGAVCA